MLPRASGLKLLYEKRDVSGELCKSVESVEYEGVAAGQSNSISVVLMATEEKWLNGWMPEKGAVLEAVIRAYNWPEEGQGFDLGCGSMVVDGIGYTDAPQQLTIRAMSKPANTDFSEMKRERVWKNTSIQQVAQTISARYGLELGFDGEDAAIEKREQQSTDSAFLEELCEDYGMTLKVYAGRLWVYDREQYKKAKPVRTVRRTDVRPGSFSYEDSFTGTYTRGIWQYSNQKTGVSIKVEIGQEGRTLRREKYASSYADAERRLRAAMNRENHNAIQVKFTMGLADLSVCETQVIQLEGYGKLNGRYFVDEVTVRRDADGLEQSFVCSKISEEAQQQAVYTSPKAEKEGKESSAQSTVASTSAPKMPAAGDKIELKDAPLLDLDSGEPTGVMLSGTYYAYDGEDLEGRFRIARLESRVGLLPRSRYAMGLVEMTQGKWKLVKE